MPTFTALTTLSNKAKAEALGEALENMTPAPTGVGVFEVEDGTGLWEVGGYFEAKPDKAALVLLASLHNANDFTISELPDVDWVAKVKRDLKPVRAGRFFVYGSHDADIVPSECEPLLIEASMAFGTGHHGTTQGCLQALEVIATSDFEPRSILDLGCGTAVLAMAAARVWPNAGVLASDIDCVAVEVAEANVAANGLVGRVRCFEAEGLNHTITQSCAPFDLITANILKSPLISLCPAIFDILAPHARLILSGILNEQAGEVCAVYVQAGNSLMTQHVIGDWTTIMFRKSV
ncbi:MAG: 50S ribosomal protein L11 methyltransferase [Pseudomonadota bacterium]